MKLLLHAGPMKTGTTAIQTFFSVNQEVLKDNGIHFVWLRRSMLDDLATALNDASLRGSVLVASHECLCRQNQADLARILAGASGDIYAWLTARPLRELYPSLYLQNLKGRVMRTTTYQEFLVEQERRDRSPQFAIKGQVFNFDYLEQHISLAGAIVRWIRYSSSHLLRDVVAGLSELVSTPLEFDSFLPLPSPSGTNPRRSLHFSVAEQARSLNFRCLAGELDSEHRQAELTKLLDQSEQIRASGQLSEPERLLYSSWLDQLDQEINGDFWQRQFRDESVLDSAFG